jgi:hypothetical protein
MSQSNEECPYVGLIPFTEADSEYFFGRDKETNLVLANMFASRFTILYGKSGVGKSSILNAGVKPKLRGRSDLIGIIYKEWRKDPSLEFMTSIYNAISDNIGKEIETFTKIGSLRSFLHKYLDPYPNKRLMIVLDQFEDYFIYNSIDDPFAKEFPLIVMDKDLPISVLISIREDSLSKIDLFEGSIPTLFDNILKIDPLNIDEANDAIIKPIEQYNKKVDSSKSITIETSLAKSVLDQIKFGEVIPECVGQGVLSKLDDEKKVEISIETPYLQLVMMRLWREEREQHSNILRQVTVDNLGGARNIIKTHLDDVMKSSSFEEKRIASSILRYLVTPGGAKISHTIPDLANYTGIAKDKIQTVLESLSDSKKRIICPVAPSSYSPELRYEIYHDVLATPILDWRNRFENERQKNETKKEIRKKLYKNLIIPLISLFIIISSLYFLKLIKINKGLETQYNLVRNKRKEADSLRKVAEIETRKAIANLNVVDSLRKVAEIETRKAITNANVANTQKNEIIDLQSKQIEFEKNLEYERTEGKLKELRDLPKDKRDQVAENLINTITGYLWSKGDSVSFNKLIRLLKDNEDVIPEYYGETSSSVPYVEDSGWPLTILYNDQQLIDYNLLNNNWQSFAINIAQVWGIPVPWRLRVDIDNYLPPSQFNIQSPSRNKEENNLVRCSIPYRPRYVIVTQNGLEEKERLNSFFLKNINDWDTVKTLITGGPWFLVPKWTQPIFKIGGHSTASYEGAVAVSVANTLVENPNLLLTDDVIKIILKKEYSQKPHTIEEALYSRGGLAGIRNDLINIVQEEIALKNVSYLLDALSNYWWDESEYSSVNALDDLADNVAIDGEIQGNRKNTTTFNIDTLFTIKNNYYKEINPYLPDVEPPVRIYMGKQIEEKCVIEDELSPQLMEALNKLRGEIYLKYGILTSGARFRVGDEIKDDQIRIEIFNQSDQDEDAQPITIEGRDIIQNIIKELRNRYICYIIYWIDADYVYNELEKFSNINLENWLLKTYTLTDIKLILRSIISPEYEELPYYLANNYDKSIESIPPQHTLYDLEWLLGSLVFWANDETIDLKSSKAIGEILRQTQEARLFPDPSIIKNNELEETIIMGIDALKKGDIKAAEKYFSTVMTKNLYDAQSIFLKIYSKYSDTIQINPIKYILRDDYYPLPGKIEDAWVLETNEMYDLENEISFENNEYTEEELIKLKFIILFNYLENEYYDRAEKTYLQILNKYSTKLDNDQKYLIGYFGLQINKAHPNNPENLKEITESLNKAFATWNVEKLSGPYIELLDLVNKYFNNYRWSWDLTIHLIKVQSESFWLNFYLASYLQGNKEQFEYSEIALNHINKAESVLTQIEESDRDRLSAWISLIKGSIYYNLAQYQMGMSSNSYCQIGIKVLENLLKQLPLEEKEGWPSHIEIISELSDFYEINNEMGKSYEILNKGLIKFPNDESLLIRKFSTFLNDAKIEQAIKLADSLHYEYPENSGYLFLLTLAEILAKNPDAEYNANKYFVTDGEYRDYIRMLLYYYLSVTGEEERGKEMLMKRWGMIDTLTWGSRFEDNDINVWREMLIGYYLGKVPEKEFIEPLNDSIAFINHPFSRLNSLTGTRCEGYFYIGLKKGADGDKQNFEKFMKEAIDTKHLSYYEYSMAKYFLNSIMK